MCDSLEEPMAAGGLCGHVDLKSVTRHVGKGVDHARRYLPLPGVDHVAGPKRIEAVVTRPEATPAQGVGASSRKRPFAFRSAQNCEGIGWLNHSRFFFNWSTVLVPAMKLGIAGWATTNCSAAAGRGTL